MLPLTVTALGLAFGSVFHPIAYLAAAWGLVRLRHTSPLAAWGAVLAVVAVVGQLAVPWSHGAPWSVGSLAAFALDVLVALLLLQLLVPGDILRRVVQVLVVVLPLSAVTVIVAWSQNEGRLDAWGGWEWLLAVATMVNLVCSVGLWVVLLTRAQDVSRRLEGLGTPELAAAPR